MTRLFASVVIGYLVVMCIVFLALSGAYLVLGSDRAFLPGSYEGNTLWNVLSLALNFVSAAVAGLVCAAVARDPRGPKLLAGLVLVIGVALAIPVIRQVHVPEVRAGDVGLLTAIAKGSQPHWVALSTPVIGALGVLLGGRRRTGAAA